MGTVNIPSVPATLTTTKISELTSATALTGTETVQVLQGGSNRRTTAQDIADLAAPGGAVDSVFGRTGAVTAVSGDYSAAQITNTPAGTISGVTVQAAIDELGQEKVSSVVSGEPTGSDAILNVVSLTQAEYDAGTPIATTVYIITDAI